MFSAESNYLLIFDVFQKQYCPLGVLHGSGWPRVIICNEYDITAKPVARNIRMGKS